MRVLWPPWSHTFGVCHKKQQDHGKATETEDKGASHQVNKANNHQVNKANKPVVTEKWMAKDADVVKNTESSSKEMDKSLPQVEILGRPIHGVTDETRTSLVNVGLLLESEPSSSRQV